MRPTKIELLEKEVINLRAKLTRVKAVVKNMDKFTHTGKVWTERDTIMFNYYTELKSIINDKKN
jgi:hypothetical protein